ncbi:MAG TPA: GvpL/GvpF family gas vesicle protein [Longimicrobiales bacterium]|nr:GvpL/GvpF family gas vesicle protein [Longimicrobiales bacterium]
MPRQRLPGPDLRGAGGNPVTAVPAGEHLACWVTEVARHPQVTADVVRAHHDVSAAAMDSKVTPVPLRFGQVFESAAAAADAIAAEETRWLELLRRFAGHAEFGVRVIAESPLAPAGPEQARDVRTRRAASGTAYMAALAERQAEEKRRKEAGDALVRTTLQRAGSLIADARHEPLTSGHGVVTMAHLVAWNDADAYHACMRDVRAESDGLRFLFSGPWPPYSFVA